MRILLVSITLLGICLSNVYSERMDGNDWKYLSDGYNRISDAEGYNEATKEYLQTNVRMVKRVYISGVVDGAQTYYLSEIKDKLKKARYPYESIAGLKPDTIVNALDEFYADYKNIKIPTVYALEIILSQISGENDDLIQDKIRFYRKFYSKQE